MPRRTRSDYDRLGYDRNVFINCPFDRQYEKMFRAIVFTVQQCGFSARCALEVNDTSQTRIEKIYNIIEECRYGIHDLSRVEVSSPSQLPRFNMPLELGIFLGAKRYGDERQRQKMGIVLDREQFRYQRFCSDIAGQDIAAHHGRVGGVIEAAHGFLAGIQRDSILIGPTRIRERYNAFLSELPTAARGVGLENAEVKFVNLTHLVSAWLQAHPLP